MLSKRLLLHEGYSSCTGWCGLSTCMYSGLRCLSRGLAVQAGLTEDCPLCCVMSWLRMLAFCTWKPVFPQRAQYT